MVHHGGTEVLSLAVGQRQAQGNLRWEWDSALCGSAGSRLFIGCGSAIFGDCLLSWPHIRVPRPALLSGGWWYPREDRRTQRLWRQAWSVVNTAVVLSKFGHHALMAAEGDWERSSPGYSTKAHKEDTLWCHPHPGLSSRKATCCITNEVLFSRFNGNFHHSWHCFEFGNERGSFTEWRLDIKCPNSSGDHQPWSVKAE